MANRALSQQTLKRRRSCQRDVGQKGWQLEGQESHRWRGGRQESGATVVLLSDCGEVIFGAPDSQLTASVKVGVVQPPAF